MAINLHPDQDGPSKPLIDEPVGDGFPAEKDVSNPPPGSDRYHKEHDPLTSSGERAPKRDGDRKK